MALRLLQETPEIWQSMTSLRFIVGIIWMSIFLVGRGIWTATAMSSTAMPPLTYEMPTTAITHPYLDEWRSAELDEPRLDLYGNEVESAVGDYRVDFRGDLYEHHAPDTAVAKLAPPGV